MRKAMEASPLEVVTIRMRVQMRKAVMKGPMKKHAVMKSPMMKNAVKVTSPKLHRRGVWSGALRCPELYGPAVASLKNNDLIEFEEIDESGARRGSCICELIGQRMSDDKGRPLVLITPRAAEEGAVSRWRNPSLAAPNALRLCRTAARLVDVGSENCCIPKVERFRVRTPGSVVEKWAAAVHEKRPDAVPLQGCRERPAT